MKTPSTRDGDGRHDNDMQAEKVLIMNWQNGGMSRVGVEQKLGTFAAQRL